MSDSINLIDSTSTTSVVASDDKHEVILPLIKQVGRFDDQDLKAFFARPRFYQNVNSATGSTVLVLNPYYDMLYTAGYGTWFAQKSKYLKFMRGVFGMKIQMTVSPYAFGQWVCALYYGPRSSTSITTTNNTLISCQNITGNHVILDCATANQGCVEIPIIPPDPFVDIATSLDTFPQTITFEMSNLVPCQNALDGTSCACSFQLFFYIKDIDLTVPTGTGFTSAYTMEEKEMTKNGPVSFPASIISSIGRSMKNVPFIGPFAYATGIIADGVGTLASLFGFSRPKSFYPKNYPHDIDLASYAGELEIKTLTLDPQQEIPVDVSHLGTNGDSMSYMNTIGREGIYDIFNWPSTSANQTLLWSAPIVPYWSPCNFIGGTTYALSPLAYCCQCYSLWRGTIHLRIVIPANKYVRGKIRFIWLPTNTSLTSSPGDKYADAIMNAPNFLIDLTQNTECEVEIPYVSKKTYMETYLPGGTLANYHALDASDYNVNGFLQAYVEEEIITQAAVTLTVLVYVKAGDDFELQIPTMDKIQYIRRQVYNSNYPGYSPGFNVKTYSPAAPVNGYQTTPNTGFFSNYTMESNENAALQVQKVKLFPYTNSQDVAINQIGEKFFSHRPMLNRFVPYFNTMNDAFPSSGFDPVDGAFGWFFIPFMPHEQFTFLDVSSGEYNTYPYLMTPFKYLANMFWGYRGAMRYHITPTNYWIKGEVPTTVPDTPTRILVWRDVGTIEDFTTPHTVFSPMNTEIQQSMGAASYNYAGEPIVVEIPYQCISQYFSNNIIPNAQGLECYGLSIGAYSTSGIFGLKIDQACPEGGQFILFNRTPLVNLWGATNLGW